MSHVYPQRGSIPHIVNGISDLVDNLDKWTLENASDIRSLPLLNRLRAKE